MGLPDALFFGLLAIADLAFIALLRRRRRRAVRRERMMRGLEFAVRSQNGELVMPVRPRLLRAS